MTDMARISILVVDPSAVMRRFLSDVLASSPRLEVVATALDAVIGRKKIEQYDPDLVLLGMGVPGIDGPAFVADIMAACPRPVVLMAPQTGAARAETMKALEFGAADFITRPVVTEIDTVEALQRFTALLVDTIVAAAASMPAVRPRPMPLRAPAKYREGMRPSTHLIAIGASAGGVPVINEILAGCRPHLPAIVIAQHMPAGFTTAFAARADQLSPLAVSEAAAGDRLYDGTALVAPGGRNLAVMRDSNGFYCVLYDDEYQTRYKPSVDLFLLSVAAAAGAAATGIILSGMGSDGSRGLLAMRESGAMTIAQDRESSIVYGMPQKALENGAAQRVMNVGQIIDYLNAAF